MKESNIVSNIILKIKRIYNDSLLKNSIYLMMSNISGLFIGFFFWIVATRYYMPNDVGIISAVLSSIFLISMISSIGLPNALIFYLPRYAKDANKIINSCLIASTIISIILSLIYISKIDIFAPQLKTVFVDMKIIIIFIITTVMMTITSLMGGMFSAGKRSSFRMIKENIFNISKTIFLVLFAGLGIIGIFISWVLGLIISTTVGFFLLYKLWKYTPMATFDPIIKKMASFSIGNYIAGMFYNLPRLAFPIMILNVVSAESAGYFFVAMTVANILYGVPLATSTSFLAESSDKNKFWNNVEKAIKFNMGLLIPGVLLFTIFGEFALNIFNPIYVNSLNTLIILSITSIPLSIVTIFCTIENAQKRIIAPIKINITIAVITFILSINLVKIWNIEGVAISYLVANITLAMIIICRMKNPIEFTLRLLNGHKKYGTYIK